MVRREAEVEVLPPEEPYRGEAVDPFLEDLSEWMDAKFEIPGLGWRFGLDPLLGLIPGLGDTVTMFISFYILSAASRLGIPRITMARMGVNVLVDFVFGSVPLLGDLFDVAWKANTRNVELLRRAVRSTPEAQRRARRGDWLFVAGTLAVLLAALLGCVVVAWFIIRLLATAAAEAMS